MNKNTERLAIGVGALVLGLLLGWMVRGAATFNTSMESSTTYDDWRTVCPAAATKDASCEMVGDIIDPKSKGVAARISISQDPKLGQVVAFVLPLQVLLEPGVGLQFGKDAPKTFKYRTCNNAGCVSVTPVDDKFVNQLGSATDVSLLSISALPGAKTQQLAVSRKGFAAARKAYLSGNRKRSSWFWRMF